MMKLQISLQQFVRYLRKNRKTHQEKIKTDKQTMQKKLSKQLMIWRIKQIKRNVKNTLIFMTKLPNTTCCTYLTRTTYF